jgi:hypothetical protein
MDLDFSFIPSDKFLSFFPVLGLVLSRYSLHILDSLRICDDFSLL